MDKRIGKVQQIPSSKEAGMEKRLKGKGVPIDRKSVV